VSYFVNEPESEDDEILNCGTSFLVLTLNAFAGDIPGLSSKKLANGLDVIVVENHAVPLEGRVSVSKTTTSRSFTITTEFSCRTKLSRATGNWSMPSAINVFRISRPAPVMCCVQADPPNMNSAAPSSKRAILSLLIIINVPFIGLECGASNRMSLRPAERREGCRRPDEGRRINTLTRRFATPSPARGRGLCE
jgi:hypothetical protein